MARSWGGTLARKIDSESNLSAFRLQTGVATLAGGQASVTGVRVTANSNFQFTLFVRNGTAMGVQYMPDLIVVGDNGSFRINALDAAMALEAGDDSEISWAIIS